MAHLPRLIVTGASGFLGKRLLEQVKLRYRVDAIDRHSQAESQVPRHPHLHWHQFDIGHRERLASLFRRIRDEGGADALVHLAAYYDFTGEDHPEYWRSNVEGTRNVLETAQGLGLRRFVFASSTAACAFPPAGRALDESSPPDGDHLYALTKRLGEEMLRDAADRVPSCIVRFAALFSDWCEYPPLYEFLGTWLSRGWNARVLGGRGESAVTYLHVRDAALFLRRVLERMDDLDPAEVLLCSPDGAVSHRQLFAAATGYFFGRPRRPIRVPKALALPGMWLRDAAGRLLGRRPFERPWMARYLDLALTVDARRTRRRLGWAPRSRLDVVRRIPFLIENFRSDPVEWERRNRAVLEMRQLHPNLRIYGLLDLHEEEIGAAFTRALAAGGAALPHYRELGADEHRWNHRLILRNLMHAVRTREKGVFMAYCRDLAQHRFSQGYGIAELSTALATLDRLCVETLARDPAASDLSLRDLHHTITMTLQFGLDQMEEVYEALGETGEVARLDALGGGLWTAHPELAPPP